MFVIIALVFSACEKNSTENDSFVPVKDLVVSDDFDWNTARRINVNLEAFTQSDEPISGMYFRIF